MSFSTHSSLSGAEWRSGSNDLHHTGFSPQNRINQLNVNSLQIKWIYQIPENPYSDAKLRYANGVQTSPLVIGGIVFFATNYNRMIALDALTGEEMWFHQVDLEAPKTKPWYSGSARQHNIVFYREAIYMLASDGTIYAFDPPTGAVKSTIPETCKDIPGNQGRYLAEAAPSFYGDIALVGAGGGGWWNGRGYVAAYSLKSHELLWRWFSSPPAGGDPDWDKDAHKGNIKPYSGDWGSSGPWGGGPVWARGIVDEETGIFYALTSNSAVGPFDAAHRPGPHLYSGSVVALDARSGEMLWYYQVTPHDINGHQPGWSPLLTTANIAGAARKVIIAASKGGYIYVLDSRTGSLVYEPVKIGPPTLNAPNTNAGNEANYLLSQKDLCGKIYCPGEQGGIAASSAFAYNTIYTTFQRCGSRYKIGTAVEGGRETDYYDLDFFVPTEELPEGWDNTSTLYAIDASNGKVNWTFNMPARYQSASLAVSGGVVYAVDRAGTLYAVDAHNGWPLKRIKLGGVGQAGVAMGANSRGEMMLFVPVGNIVVALGLPEGGR